MTSVGSRYPLSLVVAGLECLYQQTCRAQPDLGTTDDPVPAITAALWRQLARAIHQGLLPGYVTAKEPSAVLRESAQLAVRHGLPLPLEIRHDEFTADITENQILRTAAERMLLVPRVDDESRRSRCTISMRLVACAFIPTSCGSSAGRLPR